MAEGEAAGAGADRRVGGVMVGALVGMLVAGALTGLVGLLWVQRAYRNARLGWNLVPVVVAAEDIPAGQEVTFDLISQRSVPEQFVTSSVVLPEAASRVVNQRLLAPVKAGDPLRWSEVEAKGATVMLVAGRDLEAGARLGAADLVELKVRGDPPIEGWARGSEAAQLGGRKVTAAVRKGDPVLWSHLEPVPPRTQPR